MERRPSFIILPDGFWKQFSKRTLTAYRSLCQVGAESGLLLCLHLLRQKITKKKLRMSHERLIHSFAKLRIQPMQMFI